MLLPSRGITRTGPPACSLRLVMEGADKQDDGDCDRYVLAGDREGGQRLAKTPVFDAKDWKPANIVAKFGDQPWGSLNDATLPLDAPRQNLQTRHARRGLSKSSRISKPNCSTRCPKIYRARWVNLCVDPKGRLIVSDQYGPLYRITPPALGGLPADTKVEKLTWPLAKPHGLCGPSTACMSWSTKATI